MRTRLARKEFAALVLDTEVGFVRMGRAPELGCGTRRAVSVAGGAQANLDADHSRHLHDRARLSVIRGAR